MDVWDLSRGVPTPGVVSVRERTLVLRGVRARVATDVGARPVGARRGVWDDVPDLSSASRGTRFDAG